MKVRIPTAEDEAEYWAQGLFYVAGLDEAGRGPWAGPVYAAAVMLPHSPLLRASLADVRDSKTLNHRQHLELDKLIRSVSIAVGVGLATAPEIDELGIVPATRLAMQRALDALSCLRNRWLLMR